MIWKIFSSVWLYLEKWAENYLLIFWFILSLSNMYRTLNKTIWQFTRTKWDIKKCNGKKNNLYYIIHSLIYKI
jgi:hypothetical protein